MAGDDHNGTRLVASPKSASQISPGWGFIKQVEDLLFGGARARDIKDVVIGELYNLSDALLASAAVSGFHSRNRASRFSAKASRSSTHEVWQTEPNQKLFSEA